MKEQLDKYQNLLPLGWANLIKTAHSKLKKLDANYCVTNLSLLRSGFLFFKARGFVQDFQAAEAFQNIVQETNQKASVTCKICGFNGQLCLVNKYTVLFGSVLCEDCYVREAQPNENELEEYQKLMKTYKGLDSPEGPFVTRVL